MWTIYFINRQIDISSWVGAQNVPVLLVIKMAIVVELLFFTSHPFVMSFFFFPSINYGTDDSIKKAQLLNRLNSFSFLFFFFKLDERNIKNNSTAYGIDSNYILYYVNCRIVLSHTFYQVQLIWIFIQRAPALQYYTTLVFIQIYSIPSQPHWLLFSCS